MAKLAQHWTSLGYLYRKEIWKSEYMGDRSPRGLLFAVLRVVSITVTGITETKAASRAAALSFSTLLGLGPLVAIAMLVAGFVLDKNDPNLAVNTLNSLIKFVAPQIDQYERLRQQGKMPPPPENRSDVVTATRGPQSAPPAVSETAPEPAPTAETTVAVNPELVEIIDGFVSGSRSGTIGVIGALTLILIVVQLFTSIETAFNEIWGVRRGRSWLLRIVFYWTVITLGAVLFFAAVTGISAGAFFNAFAEKLPFGTHVVALLRLFLPAASITALIAVLTIFYRAIPNTHVFWRAAFIGALVVALLLLLNNFLAFLYFRRVILSRSLYGSLGILPILMFGLYIFWFFVLLGGQVSYAVQNVHFRNSQAAWHSLAKTMRERLSLAVLLTVCRRFYECAPPCTASQLSAMLKVPTQILNECLNRLVQMQLVTPIPPQTDEASTDFRYQPARPLNRITLADFKILDDELGDDPAGSMLTNIDPIMDRYEQATTGLTQSELFQKTVEDLLRDHPIDTSRPPFLFGERRVEA
ncbi:MAG TPA: YihY/virulence factor BrkB family protein [Opitutaceae bacterium]